MSRFNTITVKGLREALEGLDDNALVAFVSDYGDRSHTLQVHPSKVTLALPNSFTKPPTAPVGGLYGAMKRRTKQAKRPSPFTLSPEGGSMAKIVTPSRRVETVYYQRTYRLEVDPGSGYGFPCNVQGEVFETGLQPAALENLELCRAGGDTENPITDLGAVAYQHTYREPAILECDCGTMISLDNFTNTCTSCSADYNCYGQRLAAREQWGEETGETLGDILRIP